MQTNLIFCKFAAEDVIEKNILLSITLGYITITFENKSHLLLLQKKRLLQLHITITPCLVDGGELDSDE